MPMPGLHRLPRRLSSRLEGTTLVCRQGRWDVSAVQASPSLVPPSNFFFLQ